MSLPLPTVCSLKTGVRQHVKLCGPLKVVGLLQESPSNGHQPEICVTDCPHHLLSLSITCSTKTEAMDVCSAHILCDFIRTLPRGGMYFPMHPDSKQCVGNLLASKCLHCAYQHHCWIMLSMVSTLGCVPDIRPRECIKKYCA